MSRTDAADNAPRGITVLMPVFNGERFLRQQIQSIFTQQDIELKVLACDDASTDDSLALLRDLELQDSRLRVLRNTDNLGLNGTIARLLAEVDTRYFALSDQDDIWYPNKLAESIAALESDGASLVYSDVAIVDEAGRTVAPTYLRARSILPVLGMNPVPFVFRNPVLGHTIVSTAQVAKMASDIPADIVYHEAWLVAVACSIGGVTYINRPLGDYRQHSTNVVGVKPRGKLARLKRPMTRDYIATRQETRRAALAAMAGIHPRLTPVVAHYEPGGLTKLAHLIRFVRWVLGYRDQVGLGAVASETFAYIASAVTFQTTSRSRHAIRDISRERR